MKLTTKLKSMSGLWVSVLALGVALGGFFIGDGIYRAMSGRTVTVKGLAERNVVADTAVWNIKINGVGGDLTALQQEIDNDISQIHTFLTESGFAPSDIQNLRVQVRDKYAGYSDAELKNQQNDGRYVIETGVMVRSHNVDLVDSVSRRMGELVRRGITITEERRESMDFSDVYHVEDLAVIIRRDAGADDLEQFNSATLGVVTGSLYGGYSREQFPNASIKEFNTFADVLVALKGGKVDGIMLDKPNFNSVARTDKSLTSITVPAYSVEIGFGFQKNDAGNALQAQMNAFLAKLKAEGKIDVLIDKWYGETEPSETIPLDELASNAKTLNVAIDTTRKPFVYMYEGKPVGFEIEVLYMFCKEYGYNVNISDISFASGLAGLASEKYDLVCGGLYMTDERKESVNFSDPYMNAEVVMAKCERSGFENFMLSLRDSFEKTFIREQRWKLIAEGICTTMIISVFSVLGGTLLGFALYMLARSKTKWLSKLAKGFAKVYSTIIAGTPTLVVLMILFYIVFTSPDMSGVVVAIIGFILTFGSFVYEQLSLTVSGVDNGQLEAAYALGYSRNQTFFRIVLPQAMKMFLPSYSGEIVSLIKATSVVGYIAVNDLTKMGDIIRGNTYEAFFPLIAVAVIYFIITWIIAGIMNVIRKKAEPRLRKNKNILKGVVR